MKALQLRRNENVMELQRIAGDKLTNCAERDKKALWEAPEC